MVRDDVGLQVVASVSAVFAIWTGEAAWMTLVMSAHMSCEVCLLRKGAGAERALITEIGEEWWHGLSMIVAIVLFAESLVFEGVGPSGIVAFLTRVELVKFVGGEWGDTKEGGEEDLRVFVICREDGIDGEWCERDMDNGQREYQTIFSRSEAVDDGGVELVRVREMEIESAAVSEPFWAQGALVEAVRGVEDEGVVLEVAVTGGGKGTV